MAKYLDFAEQTKLLGTQEEVKEYLQFRKKNDKWVIPFIRECAVVGIPNIPILSDQYTSELKEGVQINAGLKTEGINCRDEDMETCIKDSGLFLAFPDEKMVIYPTIYTAFSGICQRAGLSGTTITNDSENATLSPLPVEEKAAWLTRGMSLHKQPCKILIRDEAVVADLSNEYKIIPADEAVGVLEEVLKKEHPNYSYSSGSVSHEFLVLEYYLNNVPMESSFLITLQDVGMDVDDVKAGVRFSTSDVGNAMVYASPFYVVNGVKWNLGKGCGCRHDGKGCVDVFKADLDKLGMLFKESEERVEELGNIIIQYPAGCLQKICEEKAKTLPRKAATNVIETAMKEFAGKTCYAIDIFAKLNEIVDEANKIKPLNPTQIVNFSEEVAKLMYLDYEAFDAPYSEPVM